VKQSSADDSVAGSGGTPEIETRAHPAGERSPLFFDDFTACGYFGLIYQAENLLGDSSMVRLRTLEKRYR
jgi:hypothetical protein